MDEVMLNALQPFLQYLRDTWLGNVTTDVMSCNVEKQNIIKYVKIGEHKVHYSMILNSAIKSTEPSTYDFLSFVVQACDQTWKDLTSKKNIHHTPTQFIQVYVMVHLPSMFRIN